MDKKVRFGIVGLGNQGSMYMKIFNGDYAEEGNVVANGEVTAVCDNNPEKLAAAKAVYGDKVVYFDDAETMFRSGLIDIAMIETPHYFHPELAVKALRAGLHVCIEKPAGVYTKQVKEMLSEVDKYPDRIFGVMFNQRTNPAYKKMKEMIAAGDIGQVTRTSWIITTWFRPQFYYDSGNWRATWAGEGGGVLYNQAPHQLDLFQWIPGLIPNKVSAFCHEGKWHDIEVEDDVTAYLEYPNGATGVFVTTTGDGTGTNRLEITGTKGKLVCDADELWYYKSAEDCLAFSKTCQKAFASIPCEKIKVDVPKHETSEHVDILNNLANAILGFEPLYADGREGINGVELANAMCLSSWLGKPVSLPVDADLYWAELQKRIKTSRLKTGKETVATEMTFK
ncbi:MAG: Gfo/Idh/MocA family oxidoreductase [Clostridia bacterium]|nr:Gfo/Idh/MocA family oxidoreductase [Clostridia bacterium]